MTCTKDTKTIKDATSDVNEQEILDNIALINRESAKLEPKSMQDIMTDMANKKQECVSND